MKKTCINFLERTVCISVFALVLYGCGESAGKVAAPPLEVRVIKLTEENVAISSDLPGRVVVSRQAEIRPQVSGILQKRMFEEGTVVVEGQVLYRIDPEPYEAALAAAEASLMSAKNLSLRLKLLRRSNAVSQQDFDDAEAQYLQAKAAVKSAKFNLDNTNIKAPISGVIGRSTVTEGALLTANQTNILSTIRQIDPIFVDVVQSYNERLQSELNYSHMNTPENKVSEISLRLSDGSEYPQKGELQFSEMSIDESTGMVTMRATFPNPNGLLLPGMFVHSYFIEGELKNVILIPQRSITKDRQGNALAKVVNSQGKIEVRHIDVGRVIDNKLLVKSGLKAGELLVIDGGQKTSQGMLVSTELASNSVNDLM
jgi:membrane fusion protein (multidrug efflux system)